MQRAATIQNKSTKRGIPVFFVFSLLLFIGVFLFSISAGSVGISVLDTWRILLNKIPGLVNIKDIDESKVTIIEAVRMPRVVLAALVGASLSVSGAAMQGILKNPLADGSTLGVTSGGALGAVLFIVLKLNMTVFPQLGLTLMSIIFAFLSLMLILALTYKIDYTLSTNTIILTGVIFSMFAASLTSFLVALSGDNLKQVVFWSMGSFSGRGWTHVVIMLPFFLIGAGLLMLVSRELNAFALGEEQAHYIGVNTKRIKLVILITVSVLVGVSVSVSGTIGFVGLVIPHMIRLVIGPDHRKLIPASLLLGATFLMLTDLISRTLLSPAELPIGVVTSFIGSILFIYLFYRQRNKKG